MDSSTLKHHGYDTRATYIFGIFLSRRNKVLSRLSYRRDFENHLDIIAPSTYVHCLPERHPDESNHPEPAQTLPQGPCLVGVVTSL